MLAGSAHDSVVCASTKDVEIVGMILGVSRIIGQGEMDMKDKALIEKTKQDLILVRKCISIKLKGILYRGKKEHGASDCFLCNKYLDHSDSFETACDGCPIRQHTGHKQCAETPYMMWENAGFDKVEDKESAGYAVAEINFLFRIEQELQKKLNRRVGKLRQVKIPAKWNS
jgi:hypothetical protein